MRCAPRCGMRFTVESAGWGGSTLSAQLYGFESFEGPLGSHFHCLPLIPRGSIIKICTEMSLEY
jgi:hypothetical protein